MKNFIAMLWQVMTITGKGYQKHSLRHTGIGNDRRKDKLDGSTKFERQLRKNGIHAPSKATIANIQRRARNQFKGV